MAAGGFTPGTLLAGRYRIVGLIGRGGMGEVYRADDLKLGQVVALKFLPKELAGDATRRERFYVEVRVARQVSHPNVCRVYDIGEIHGRQFLTMEYIDGEDLKSLLSRIGQVSPAKTIELARQLCAGLAAAHDKGVLHRDLKPANIMIDGRGRVRVTDFGLAVAIEHAHRDGDLSGTPLYMAPEQLAGQPATVQSDIYALGLVLYELCTGQRAFPAAALAELRRMKEQGPAAPSEIARGVDPVVERVIQRCLEPDARLRPAHALQVAAALPGGDPLAAALAAGETPSPEMVAASGPHEGLRPPVAWALLLLILAGLAVFAFVGRDRQLMAKQLPDRPPDAMVERSREILRAIGHAVPMRDEAFGIDVRLDSLTYVLTHDRSAERFSRLPAETVSFWYRQSPRTLHRTRFLNWYGLAPGPSDPPLFYSGEVLITLDAHGRLINLVVVPAQVGPATERPAPADWAPLFREAGLDQLKWARTASEWTPATYADTREAWTGAREERPEIPLRVEAASYQGRPISFSVIGPWNVPDRMEAVAMPTGVRETFLAAGGILTVIGLAALMLARRNLRLGRGDRRGATRVAALVIVLQSVNWVLEENHVAGPWEFYLFVGFAGWALFLGGLVWVLYLALEPHVRRTWPSLLVSWNRLLAGDVRNPLLGRDVLIGCASGVFGTLVFQFGLSLPARFGRPAENLAWVRPQPFLSPRLIVSDLAFTLTGAIVLGLAFVLLLSVLRRLTRSQVAAIVLSTGLGTLNGVLQSESLAITIAPVIVASAIYNLVMARFGLVATIVSAMVSAMIWSVTLAAQVSAWYSPTAMTQAAVLVAVVLFGFYTSLGKRPMFGRLSFD